MWLWFVTDGPQTMKPEANALQKMMITMSTLYVYHSHTDRTYSHHWRQKRAITLSSRLFLNTRVVVLVSVMVEVVAWPEAHRIWVLLQADSSQWLLVAKQVQHVPRFLPWMLLRQPLLLAQYVDLDVRLYCLSRTWSMGVGMCHRPLLKAATHHWYIVSNMGSNPPIYPSSFPQAYNTTLFKWLKLFNRSHTHWWGMVVPFTVRLPDIPVSREQSPKS